MKFCSQKIYNILSKNVLPNDASLSLIYQLGNSIKSAIIFWTGGTHPDGQ